MPWKCSSCINHTQNLHISCIDVVHIFVRVYLYVCIPYITEIPGVLNIKGGWTFAHVYKTVYPDNIRDECRGYMQYIIV